MCETRIWCFYHDRYTDHIECRTDSHPGDLDHDNSDDYPIGYESSSN